MSDICQKFLLSNGPSLSSELSEYLVKAHGLTREAARKRVSRAGGEVRRLAYITFPRRARFLYLQQQFASPTFWDQLSEALIDANTAYGLAIAAIRQRDGLIPVAHFAIACGAPVRQVRHLSPDTIFERLSNAGLLQKVTVQGVGECIALVQTPGYYDFLGADVRARLVTEEFLLIAIRDWVRKLGIVSHDKVAIRKNEIQPRVGTFAWDLTAPSYLGPMVRFGKNGSVKPGFVACDVYLGSEMNLNGVKPFISKCVTLRALRNVGACLQILVADKFSKDAFVLLKQKGVIPATPRNLFGEEVAEGLTALSQVLRRAAESAIDPNAFDQLFRKLGKIEGASTQLRGTLFEYLVADVARKTGSTRVLMNRVFKSAKGAKAEADVIAITDDISITFIECKGYNPDGELPDRYLQRWLQHNVPLFFHEARVHPDWKNLQVRFEFWTTGSLSDEASAMFETAQKKINASRYTIELRLGPDIHKICESTKDHGLVTAFRKHFLKIYPSGTK